MGLTYYKKNVPFTVVVRRHALDNQGVSLNEMQNWIAIKDEDLRDFKIANRKHLSEGMVVETSEPDFDIVTPNQVTDAEMDDLLKNYLKLKHRLEDMDSVAILSILLEKAKDQNKSMKVVKLIEARLEELNDDIISPAQMQGAFDR